MIIYQVHVTCPDIDMQYWKHFRNKRKALAYAKEASIDLNEVTVTKQDTGKVTPFELVKMYGDIDTHHFIIGPDHEEDIYVYP